MANASQIARASRNAGGVRRHAWCASSLCLSVLAIWQLMAMSGLFYSDVVPTLQKIGAALVKLLSHQDFYWNLWFTLDEIALGLSIGGVTGVIAGLIVGANKFIAKAFEPYLYYLGPTPKIIFFPVMIMWFGVGRRIEDRDGRGVVLLSDRAQRRRRHAPDRSDSDQGRRELPRQSLADGDKNLSAGDAPSDHQRLRLGLGVALVGTLLAETKISNRGIGFLVIQAYANFDMPGMYAILIVLFVLAIGANTLVARLGGLDDIRQR